jgi:hypothetical protein
MRRTTYRATVLACALAWLLVGLHLPALHAMTHHGARASWSVVALVAALVLGALAALAALLRDAGGGRPAGPGAPAV